MPKIRLGGHRLAVAPQSPDSVQVYRNLWALEHEVPGREYSVSGNDRSDGKPKVLSDARIKPKKGVQVQTAEVVRLELGNLVRIRDSRNPLEPSHKVKQLFRVLEEKMCIPGIKHRRPGFLQLRRIGRDSVFLGKRSAGLWVETAREHTWFGKIQVKHRRQDLRLHRIGCDRVFLGERSVGLWRSCTRPKDRNLGSKTVEKEVRESVPGFPKLETNVEAIKEVLAGGGFARGRDGGGKRNRKWGGSYLTRHQQTLVALRPFTAYVATLLVGADELSTGFGRGETSDFTQMIVYKLQLLKYYS
ncbi:hypothetical protein B0H11DRAFT_1903837 [Mycena galericulata]|nr:hypothetical protein B0H11DRAFT_1903837 [Mycena galericulata]